MFRRDSNIFLDYYLYSTMWGRQGTSRRKPHCCFTNSWSDNFGGHSSVLPRVWS